MWVLEFCLVIDKCGLDCSTCFFDPLQSLACTDQKWIFWLRVNYARIGKFSYLVLILRFPFSFSLSLPGDARFWIFVNIWRAFFQCFNRSDNTVYSFFVQIWCAVVMCFVMFSIFRVIVLNCDIFFRYLEKRVYVKYMFWRCLPKIFPGSAPKSIKIY